MCAVILNGRATLGEVALFATGLSSEGGVRLPLGGSAGGSLLHHLVDLLERETLGLGDEQVGVDEGQGAETAPDEEDGRLHVASVLANHVGGNDGNDGVPEPVGGGGETHTAGADRQREDLTNENPGTGTPCRGEEEDEDRNEGNLSVNGRDVVGECALGIIGGGGGVSVVEADSDTDDGDEELADKHAKSAPEEDGAATPLLNGEEGDGSGADVDDGEDHGDEESVGDGTGGLEEGSRVVEDEVDTSPAHRVVSDL